MDSDEEGTRNMTTGQDEADPRGPNLLAGVPGEPAAPGGGPAATERLLAAVLEIRERLTALETAASSERPPPVTRELWHGILPFLLVVALLAVEWSLRRAWGMR